MGIISTRGYQGLSLREVARVCGMSAPGLLHYFADLPSLLLAVLAYRDAIDLEALGPDVPGGPHLRPFLDRVVRYNSERPEAARFFAMLQGEALNPQHPAHEFFRKRTATGVEAAASLLDPADGDPTLRARSILAVMDGLQLNWLSDPDNFDLNAQWAVVADALLPRAETVA